MLIFFVSLLITTLYHILEKIAKYNMALRMHNNCTALFRRNVFAE